MLDGRFTVCQIENDPKIYGSWMSRIVLQSQFRSLFRQVILGTRGFGISEFAQCPIQVFKRVILGRGFGISEHQLLTAAQQAWSSRQNWTKLEEIDPNWAKLGLMRVTVSYRCLLLDEAGAETCKVMGEVRGVAGGAGAHHHPQPH